MLVLSFVDQNQTTLSCHSFKAPAYYLPCADVHIRFGHASAGTILWISMYTSKMKFLVITLILAVSCAQGFNLRDPSSWVDSVSNSFKTLNDWEPPDFCGKSECPPFSVEKTTQDYEVRTYEKGNWVMTTVTGSGFAVAYTKATARLVKYFKGANTNSTKIEMTVPTLVEYKMKDEPSNDDEFSFSMWLPSEYQEAPPRPTDEGVDVKEFEEVTVFVKVFGGFATDNSIKKQAKDLMDTLDENDEDYNGECVYVAIYDPAVKLLNRHNEVHVVRGSSRVVSS